jgi:hypothetical protein
VPPDTLVRCALAATASAAVAQQLVALVASHAVLLRAVGRLDAALPIAQLACALARQTLRRQTPLSNTN